MNHLFINTINHGSVFSLALMIYSTGVVWYVGALISNQSPYITSIPVIFRSNSKCYTTAIAAALLFQVWIPIYVSILDGLWAGAIAFIIHRFLAAKTPVILGFNLRNIAFHFIAANFFTITAYILSITSIIKFIGK